jgi:hypothetical protein
MLTEAGKLTSPLTTKEELDQFDDPRDKAALLVERKHEEDRLRRNREQKEALDKQLQEAEARKKAEKEEFHKPAFTPHFFEAFGKTDF